MALQVLTPEQCDFFNRYGYLHLKSFVPESLLNTVQRPIDRWVDRAIRRWTKKGLLTNNFAKLPFNLRLYRAWEAAKRPFYNECITQEIASPEMFNFLTYPGFVGLAQDLLAGNNIQASAGYMCRPKLPTSAFPIDTPWHQDAQCFPLHGMQLARIITIWIPFMDVDETNSCLQVSEASHINAKVFEDVKNGTIHYSISPEYSDKFINLRSIPMRRGDALCLHQLVAHRALPNMSDKMRWSMDIRYEQFNGADAPVPRRGFVCAHEDPSRIDSTAEAAFHGLWAYTDPSAD